MPCCSSARDSPAPSCWSHYPSLSFPHTAWASCISSPLHSSFKADVGLGRVQAGSASLGGASPTPPRPSLDWQQQVVPFMGRGMWRGLRGKGILCPSGVCLREQPPNPAGASADLCSPLLSWTSACHRWAAWLTSWRSLPPRLHTLRGPGQGLSSQAPLCSSVQWAAPCEAASNARGGLGWRGPGQETPLFSVPTPCKRRWACQSRKAIPWRYFGLLGFIFHHQLSCYQTT